MWFDPRVGKIPWRRKWQPTPVFLPGKSHGQRSLMGYSLRSCKKVRHDLVTKQPIHMDSCPRNILRPVFFQTLPDIQGASDIQEDPGKTQLCLCLLQSWKQTQRPRVSSWHGGWVPRVSSQDKNNWFCMCQSLRKPVKCMAKITLDPK